jgi:hypothetical protein
MKSAGLTTGLGGKPKRRRGGLDDDERAVDTR